MTWHSNHMLLIAPESSSTHGNIVIKFEPCCLAWYWWELAMPWAVEFPFMIVWVVDGRLCDAPLVISKVRQYSLEELDPTKTGFTCTHYFDTFDEVATLARPPLGTSK